MARGGRNATTVMQRKSRKAFPSAPSEVRQVNRYIASSGLKVICSRTPKLSWYSGIDLINGYREIFGTSEDDAPELDFTADSDNGT